MATDKKSETKVCFENGRVRVYYSVVAKVKENGKHLCVIPGFNLMFSANNDDEVTQRSGAMIKTYINYYLKEENFQSLLKKLHQIGFRAPEQHAYIMKELLNKKRRNAKFKSNNETIPNFFDDGKRIENLEMEEMAY